MTPALRRLLNVFVCQHLELVREHAADGWRFRCVRCRRSCLVLDRSDDPKGRPHGRLDLLRRL